MSAVYAYVKTEFRSHTHTITRTRAQTDECACALFSAHCITSENDLQL